MSHCPIYQYRFGAVYKYENKSRIESITKYVIVYDDMNQCAHTSVKLRIVWLYLFSVAFDSNRFQLMWAAVTNMLSVTIQLRGAFPPLNLMLKIVRSSLQY